jgi:hypothetical protein
VVALGTTVDCAAVQHSDWRRLEVPPQSSSEDAERAWRYKPSAASGGDESVDGQIDLRLRPDELSLLQNRCDVSTDAFPRGPRSNSDVLKQGTLHGSHTGTAG